MKHFISHDYIYIKTDHRQVSLRLDGQTPMSAVHKHRDGLECEIDRMTRQLRVFDRFLRGESVSHPDALRP
jgi:hypothetical protein